MKRLFHILLLIISGLIGNSCRREIHTPEWDVDVLAPILSTNFTINDLLADSLLQVNPDQSITLASNTNFYGLTLDSLVSIPDTTIPGGYGLPFGQLVIPPGGNIATLPSSTQYSLNGIQLSKTIIRSGFMNVQIKSKIAGKTKITYTIPCATLNSVPFQATVYMPPRINVNTPSVVNASYDLSGYVIDMRGQSLNSYNTIYTSMILDVDPAAPSSVTINAGDSMIINNSFVDIVPQYAKGYFGQGNYVAADTSAFSMFNHIIGGTLLLDSVNIKLKIENTVGADAKLKINSLTSINSRTGGSVPLAHPIIGASVNINRAIDFNGNVLSSLYSVQLDNTNSNIKQMIENLPDKIGYSVNADINPLGNVSGGNDFIYYGGGLRLNLDMQIPLWFAANQLTLADTIDYSISSDNQNVNSGTLTLYADNGFPFEASVQLFIMNSNNVIIDEITGPVNTIDEGIVDANYVVTQPRRTKLEIPVSAGKMDELYANKRLYIKLKLNTAGYPNYVKIYDHYKIALQLTGDFNYHVAIH